MSLVYFAAGGPPKLVIVTLFNFAVSYLPVLNPTKA